MLQYLEELKDSNDESQDTQVSYTVLMINMQRLTPKHEDRLLRWLRGRFVKGLGHVNYSLDMIKGYWGCQGQSEHDPSSILNMLEAVGSRPEENDGRRPKILALHHSTLSVRLH